MKSDRDTPDEFFEYEAEEFLVTLALLITEGRTPEYSPKGRTEGIHCPPTKSSQPVSVKHECSDKLAQCRQAKRIRSETVVLWKNNSSIMVEVMLLPDCCYSDEEPTTEGSDVKDPAIKQDALLLERWLLEPVPRQSGDRIIEEKTLLLAVRSFVFFSQLSAWLSVSHGAVPRNIMYRVSAADAELQWTFSQPPTEHVFPVPNVSHNVALKVSVQSLPRQSTYPVLNCSIHTNLSFYEKRIQKHERSTRQHCDSVELEPHIVASTQHPFGKPVWTMAPERLMHTRTCLSPDPTSSRNSKLYSVTSHGYDPEISDSSTLSGKNARDPKMQLNEPQVRGFKSLSFVSPHVPSTLCPTPPILEANPLIGALLQERQEVIARIAQHLIHCDPPSSHLPGLPFNVDDAASIHSKRFWNPSSNESLLKNEPSSAENSSLYSLITEEDGERKVRGKPHTPSSSCRSDSEHKTSPKPPARRKLFLAQSSEPLNCTFPQLFNKTANPLTCTTLSSCKENVLERECTVLPEGPLKEKVTNKDTSKHRPTCKNRDYGCANKCKESTVPDKKSFTDVSSNLHLNHSETHERSKKVTANSVHTQNHRYLSEDPKTTNVCENKIQLISIQNYFNKDNDSFKCTEKLETSKTLHDENEDPGIVERLSCAERNVTGNRSIKCERLKHENVTKTISLRHSAIWKKREYRSLDGTSTNAFHPRTGLPLLSSPVPQRKTKSGHFDLDTSVLQFKSLSTRSPQQYLNKEDSPDNFESSLSTSAPPVTSLSLLGNFEESVLNYRLEPLGIVDGFTADVGASGLFCPTHMTLPVDVSFYSVSDDNAPSPYMGVITLESLGKRGYRVPPSGTIQVTLFNPNKTVVKMFVVIYDLREMPANQQTFLRQRTFSIPVKREMNGNVNEENILQTEERTLRYLIHLRFQSSKSGKTYLHRDVRLLFSRKSMEVDSGAAYKLKSYTESPTNPQFSPRC